MFVHRSHSFLWLFLCHKSMLNVSVFFHSWIQNPYQCFTLNSSKMKCSWSIRDVTQQKQLFCSDVNNGDKIPAKMLVLSGNRKHTSLFYVPYFAPIFSLHQNKDDVVDLIPPVFSCAINVFCSWIKMLMHWSIWGLGEHNTYFLRRTKWR